MTVPNVTAPLPIGAAGRSLSGGVGDHLADRPPVSKRKRSVRNLTPFVFLAMILIPSLIVLCLAIADPGAKSPGSGAGPAVAVAPGP